VADRPIIIRIRRQDRPDSQSYWQTFEIPYEPQMNVITCLQRIAALCRTKDGERVSPVAWDCNCLEEVCGACSMLINGKVRQACTALVDDLISDEERTIRLEPMTKFPVVRDLVVDRSRMFEALKRVKAWIPLDGYYDVPMPPLLSAREQEQRYPLTRCMTCGCCLEACPQVNENTEFIGAAAISQAMLFNSHPTGRHDAAERLEALMAPGGLGQCGNSQNCVKVCPKDIPLTDSIAKAGRALTVYAVKRWLER
jgi:succinate dehydrogenase / fumarate reductase iron-sulfur subunit